MQAPGVFSKVAVARARDVRARMAFGLFIAVAAYTFTGGWVPLAWIVAVAVFQFLEIAVSRPLRLEQDVPRPRLSAYIVIVFINAALYSSIAVWIYFHDDGPGRLFAVLTPAGALLNVAVTMEKAPRPLQASWLPHIAYLIGLPLAAGWMTPEKDMVAHVFLALGAALFVAHVVFAARHIESGSSDLRAARDAADVERRRAEQASLAKSDFLATMSHEIRTPMNAVLASADLLRRTRLTRAQAEHVAMLANSSELLMGILNDVLDLAKIESGKLSVECVAVALPEKLDAAVRLWSPRAEEKAVTLRLEGDGLPERIMADPLRLQQIVFNLLSNAVKFTDRGEILVRGGVAGDRVWLEVVDSGCGMTREMCDRVFSSFEQGSSGVTRTHGGTGLGLSISRRLAELMGGALTVSSQEGAGSVFRLEIPYIEAEAAAAPEAAPARAEDPHAERLDILLAEDHPVNQRIVRLMLEPAGCVITVAQNGAEAVSLANQRPYDVILMDMQMPVMGGVEAASCIRLSAGPNAETPIIALTANVMDDHRAQWSAIGVDTFLAKPIDMNALIATVFTVATRSGDARRAA